MENFYQKIIELLLGVQSKHYSSEELEICLRNKFEKYNRTRIKSHIDHCKNCWKQWNEARWNVSIGSRGLTELEEYLGGDFQKYYDSSVALANEWVSNEPESKDEVNDFYRKNKNYLYNLTIWFESGDRPNFADEIKQVAEKYDVHSFLDFGCGVGNDGLELIEQGYNVTFADFECPSVDFLKWRAKKRGIDIDFIDIEHTTIYPPTEVFFAIDVLEHVLDPLDVIDRVNPKTKVFIHHSEFNDIAGGRHPFHFNFDIRQLNARLIESGFEETENDLFSVWVRN